MQPFDSDFESLYAIKGKNDWLPIILYNPIYTHPFQLRENYFEVFYLKREENKVLNYLSIIKSTISIIYDIFYQPLDYENFKSGKTFKVINSYYQSLGGNTVSIGLTSPVIYLLIDEESSIINIIPCKKNDRDFVNSKFTSKTKFFLFYNHDKILNVIRNRVFRIETKYGYQESFLKLLEHNNQKGHSFLKSSHLIFSNYTANITDDEHNIRIHDVHPIECIKAISLNFITHEIYIDDEAYSTLITDKFDQIRYFLKGFREKKFKIQLDKIIDFTDENLKYKSYVLFDTIVQNKFLKKKEVFVEINSLLNKKNNNPLELFKKYKPKNNEDFKFYDMSLFYYKAGDFEKSCKYIILFLKFLHSIEIESHVHKNSICHFYDVLILIHNLLPKLKDTSLENELFSYIIYDKSWSYYFINQYLYGYSNMLVEYIIIYLKSACLYIILLNDIANEVKLSKNDNKTFSNVKNILFSIKNRLLGLIKLTLIRYSSFINRNYIDDPAYIYKNITSLLKILYILCNVYTINENYEFTKLFDTSFIDMFILMQTPKGVSSERDLEDAINLLSNNQQDYIELLYDTHFELHNLNHKINYFNRISREFFSEIISI